MSTRQVLPTDDALVNGKPIQRAFIAQTEAEFAQIVANLIGAMDNIINNPDATYGAKINATKEMRFLIVEQVKILAEIERRQDAQLMENRSSNLRDLVAQDPVKALVMVDSEIKKLTEFRGWIVGMVGNPLFSTIKSVALNDVSDPDNIDGLPDLNNDPF